MPRNMGTKRSWLIRAGVTGCVLLLAVSLPGLDPVFPSPDRAMATPPQLASLYSGMRWRLIGPFRGGRCDAATGVPGRPNEFYFGHVNGGVWKTTDGGRVWKPVFDSVGVASIGAIAVAQSAPDTLYVGTGESTLRDSASYGNGVYKSTDAGKTWVHLGLEETQHIAAVAASDRTFCRNGGHASRGVESGCPRGRRARGSGWRRPGRRHASHRHVHCETHGEWKELHTDIPGETRPEVVSGRITNGACPRRSDGIRRRENERRSPGIRRIANPPSPRS